MKGIQQRQRLQIRKCLHGFTLENRFVIYRIQRDEYVGAGVGEPEFNKHELYLWLSTRSLKNIIVFQVHGGAIDFKFPVIVGADIGNYT